MPALTLSLGLRGNLLSSTAPFSPASLFALSEPGVWYDPSDLTTMFTDTAGTTPATVGTSVALLLDKSKGLVLGSELVTNGDFSSGTTGWVLDSASIVASQLQISNVSTGVDFAVSLDTVMSGKFYSVAFTIASLTGAGVSLDLVASGGSSNGTFRTAAGAYTEVILATGSQIRLRTRGLGTTTATIDNISVRELPGFHATQSTTTARPILRQDGGGRYYLEFDGTDDWLVTPTITPGIDKAQVFAGVRKLSDAAQNIVAEFSVSTSLNSGAFALSAPGAALGDYAFYSRGSIAPPAGARSLVAPPSTNVLTSLGDISGDLATLRVDGTQVAQSTADQGTGNYLAYPLYIGRRGGTSLPFNGHLYSLVVRFGANLDAGTISSAEGWVAGKTGVTL